MAAYYSKVEGEKKVAGEFRLGRRPALDGLRGIFIILVMGVHGGIPFMSGGSMGVDGFFALSGFLITSLLLQERQQTGSISLKRFYIRRALRLLPALYAMLAVFSVFTAIALRGEGAVATWRGIVLSSFYSSNMVTVLFQNYEIGFGLVNHTWSLALEEQFYLLWPVLLIGLLSLGMSRRRLALCTGALVFAAPLWRMLLMSEGYSAPLYYLGIFTRTDALFIGCTLGVLAAGGLVAPSVKAARATRWIALVGIVVFAYFLLNYGKLEEWFSYYWSYTFIGLCAGTFMLHLLVSPQGRMAQILSWKPLVQVGVVSYGIYLWHNPVFQLLTPGSAGWLDVPIQFSRLAVTTLLVVISYRYVEKPMLKLKERFAEKALIQTQTPVALSPTES